MAVYVIGPEGGPYKIGKADEPVTRLSDLQIGNWNKLELITEIVGGLELEAELHKKFSKKRIRGEWFDLNEKDLERLRDMGKRTKSSLTGVGRSRIEMIRECARRSKISLTPEREKVLYKYWTKNKNLRVTAVFEHNGLDSVW